MYQYMRLNSAKWIRSIFIGLLSFMVLHILSNLYLLIIDPQISDNGKAILTDAMLIWFGNLFPQYQSKVPGWEEWRPKFLDYLFFSFFTSTGFSPADTLPLSKRIKFMMMLEAFTSLIIIGMVASRAISLIQ